MTNNAITGTAPRELGAISERVKDTWPRSTEPRNGIQKLSCWRSGRPVSKVLNNPYTTGTAKPKLECCTQMPGNAARIASRSATLVVYRCVPLLLL